MKSFQNLRIVFYVVNLPLAFIFCSVSLTGCSKVQTTLNKKDEADTPAIPKQKVSTSTSLEKKPVNLLININELLVRAREDGMRILDTRSEEQYKKWHILGAVRIDLADWKALSLSDGGLQNKEAWSEKISKLGIDREKTNVVVYSKNGADISDAARAWWLLKYLGVAHVAVLDGGFDRMVSMSIRPEEQVITTDVSKIEPVEFEPQFQTDRLIEIEDLKESIKAEKVNVVDTRSIIEYKGTGGGGTRKGHFPKATHIEWHKTLAPDGQFKSPQDLRQMFEKTYSLPADELTVTHCQTGGRSSVDALALEIAGYKNIKNYYCGWKEWSADSEAPIER